MSYLTALEDLHEDLILIGQPEDRRNAVAENLTEALKECLDFLSDKDLQRRKVTLYPCEILAAQHFLTQFGFHLKRVSIRRDHVEEPLAYAVFPNWK